MDRVRAKRVVLSVIQLVLAAAFGSACDHDDGLGSLTPNFLQEALIVDGAHSAGTPGFYFRPPMVGAPTVTGPFEARLDPVVAIDEVIPGSGVAVRPVATLQDVVVDLGTEEYHVNWNTSAFEFDPAQYYRISVLVGGRVLGFADVDVVENGRELKIVDQNLFVPLIDGRTLPIKFRIEQFVVDADQDELFDFADNCPSVSNANQQDTDGDGVGDACECVAVTCVVTDQCLLAACDQQTGECVATSVEDGTECLLDNAVARCGAGTCEVVACGEGFGDCDGVRVNGCEVDLTSSPEHCGSCGATCACGEPAFVGLPEVNGDWASLRTAVAGGFAYVPAYNSGLLIYDVSNLRDVRLVSSISFAAPTQDVAVQDGYAYVAANTAGLQIVDVHDPENPTRVGGETTLRTDRVTTVVTSGNFLFLGGPRVEVLDISDPVAPIFVKAVNGAGTFSTATMTLSGSHLYLSNIYRGVGIVDVSVPALAEVAAIIAPAGTYAVNADVDGTTLYVADWASGLRVYSVADVAHPALLATVSPKSGWATSDVVVTGDKALVASLQDADAIVGTVDIIDVSAPSAPTVLDSVARAGFMPKALALDPGRDGIVFVNGYTDAPHSTSNVQVLDLGCLDDDAPVGGTPVVASENPNGEWSYGKAPTHDGAFTPLDFFNPNWGGLVAWWNAGDYPAAFYNPNQYDLHPWGTTTFPPGTIALHPAANGSYAVLRWTARIAGRYAIDGTFTGLSGYAGAPPTTTEVGIVRAGSWLDSGLLNLDGASNTASFSRTLVLDAGETIDFVVGAGNGSHLYDSTGVKASVTLECVGTDCALTCAPSTGDCDGDPGNGCETTTASDPTQCGGCGIVCTGPEGAAVSCDEGQCSYTQSAAALPTISVPGGGLIVWPDGTIRAFGDASGVDISPDGAVVEPSSGQHAPAIWIGEEGHLPIVTDGYQDRWAFYQDGTLARQLTGGGCCNVFRQAFAIDPVRGLGYSHALNAVDLRTGVTVAQVGFIPGDMSMSETVAYATLTGLNVGSLGVYRVGPPSGLEVPLLVHVDVPWALRRGAVDWDDTLLVTSASGRLARVLPDGTIEYSLAIGATTPPVIGGAANVLVGTDSGTVEARSIDDGAAVWSTPVGGAPSRIVAGSEGMTYGLIPSIRTLVVLETETGVVLYTVVDLPADASEMLLENSAIVIGTARQYENVVLRLPVDSAGYDPASPWPVIQHDNQRTAFRRAAP